MSTQAQLETLKHKLREVSDLSSVGAVLGWDQATYMPDGGGDLRGRQLALIGRLTHERASSRELGDLLKSLREAAQGKALSEADAALVRVAYRDYERMARLPSSFVQEVSEHTSKTYMAWTKARPANDWATMRPLLEKTLELSKRSAAYYPEFSHPMDALMDEGEPGCSLTYIKPLFAKLREETVKLLREVQARPAADVSCLRGKFPIAQQVAFGERVIRAYGYDFNRGRQDTTHHPFCTRFGHGDVRITTRYRDDDVGDGLFSTLHEAGHAMYEQGVDEAFDAGPLASGVSTGVHESQSRLWENIVGRSRGFWSHYYPELQREFPSFQDVPMETFYRAINRVEPSLIRVDADELTYNLHVFVRFELETELHEGKLAIRDLPEAWRAKYRDYLGVASNDDRDGCLQDVHWYGGLIGGYFQGYTLGNILAAQFFESAVKAHPAIPTEIARGEFATLRGWLRENLHKYGRQYDPPELIRRATGQELSVEPYLRYLRGKFLEPVSKG